MAARGRLPRADAPWCVAVLCVAPVPPAGARRARSVLRAAPCGDVRLCGVLTCLLLSGLARCLPWKLNAWL